MGTRAELMQAMVTVPRALGMVQLHLLVLLRSQAMVSLRAMHSRQQTRQVMISRCPPRQEATQGVRQLAMPKAFPHSQDIIKVLESE